MYSGTDTSTADSVVKVDVELQANQSEIDKIKGQITNEFNDVVVTPTSNSPSTKTTTTTVTAKELNPMQQAQKEISALTEEALTADEARRKVIKEEIADLQKQVKAYKQIQDYVTGKGTAAQVIEEKVSKPLSVSDMITQEREKMGAQQTALDSTTLSTLLRDSIQNNIDVGTLLDSPTLEIQAGIDVPEATWQGIIDQYNELREQIGLDPIQVNLETGKNEVAKQMKSDWKDAAGAVQSLGSALQSIEDPAAKVIGIIAQAIATVALTFSKSLAGTVTPWDWIAAAAAGTATMISTITAIKSATAGNYAEGGIVPGNSFSGDNLTANVNSGELILSMAQQDNLTSLMMQGSEGGQVAPSLPFVTADKIVLGINNWGKRNGYGELVFSRR